ncbi:AfsR/SARP family transcriptional regulator [Agromyces bauzanensis]
MLNALAERPRVSVLGPVMVEGRDGSPVEPPGTLAKALIAVLTVAPRRIGGVVPVEVIADELWGDARPRNAKAALQTLVSRLRSVAAEGLIVSTSGGYALALADDEVDLGLATMVDHEIDGDDDGPLAALDAALALWRGEPAHDLGDAPIAEELGERAGRLRLRLLERRAAARATTGDHAGAAADLELAASAQPLNESLLAAWMRALAASGRRAEALSAYARFRSRLRDELGVSPSSELVALHAALLRADGPGGGGGVAGEPRAGGGSSRLRIGLRAAPNELIGRDRDVAAVRELLGSHRLVTVLGTGGLGKTRLAQEVAARTELPAVIVVELASVRSDDDVVFALASTLGIREAAPGQQLAGLAARPDLRARIVGQLAERPTLLVLDNCEQVIAGAASWAAELLAAAPALVVLATSRSPLAVGAEQAYPLEPLAALDDRDDRDDEPGSPGDAPAPGPAARLFLERARAVRPAATLPLDVVARLCDRLDGLPLAIELAAVRVRSLSVAQVEARLEHRFELLSTGDRSAPERQRTLQAVIEWSWALLGHEEQLALTRLSWFPDGFDADAAIAVVGPNALQALDGLVAQSLLGVSELPGTGTARYRMLETVREFGQVRLEAAGEKTDVVAAMTEWARSVAGSRLAETRSGRQVEALRALTVEEDNLIAILRLAIAARDSDTVFIVFAALGYAWTVRSMHSEVMGFSQAIIDATRGSRPGPATAMPATLTYALVASTNLIIGAPTGVRALARLRSLRRRGLPVPPALDALGGVLTALPDQPLATSRLHAMTDSDYAETALLGSLLRAQFEENDGDPESARRDARRAVELARQTGDVWSEALSAMMLAQLASQSAEPDEALRWSEAARRGLRLIEAEQDVLQLEWIVTGSLLSAGRIEEARPRLAALLVDERTTADGLVLSSVGEFGSVELARLDGRPGDASDHARRLLDSFAKPAQRSSPWFLLVLAGLVSGSIHDGRDADEVARWAGMLRRRMIATLRVWPGHVDKPVLGTVALGWSAWALRQPELRPRGLELLAVGELLRPRQDVPALRVTTHLAEAERIAGVESVQRARSAARAVAPHTRAGRARELLAAPVPEVGS